MPYGDSEKQKAYLAQHYKNNKDLYYTRAVSSRQRRVDRVNELKNNPCADCGQSYPSRVMHFHHLDPSIKSDGVSTLIRTAGWPRIEAEIAKCVLLCANCHALRH